MVFSVALLARHAKFFGDWIIGWWQPPKRKTSGSRALPEVARMVNTRRGKVALFGRCERALSAERHGQDALVLGSVESGRPQALCLAERDLLSVKRRLDACVEHVNRETEARDWIPIGHSADGPVVEARIACSSGRPDDVLGHSTTAGAEQVAVDDRV